MTRAMKRAVIAISTSSSSEEEEMSSEESEDSDSSSTCHIDDSEDDDSEESEGMDEDSSSCRRVVQPLKENCDIQVLTLMESKAYLRRHGLRLSGTRAECIQRIKEHLRIKDGNGEVLYPRSTFSIDCTGDVCREDVVLFNQKVYKKFDKASRRGRFSGKRWVAGRVIKESYGAAKQQHTFTVEVLWSNGVDKLPVLYPLLIKGRNLYRMKTFRQRWKDENQRAKVLAEKHERGDAARSLRDTRWAKSAKRKQNASANTKERKRQKKDHQHTQSFQKVRPFVEVSRLVEEHTNPANMKEIRKQKVTQKKKTSKLSGSISNPNHTYTSHPFEVRSSLSQPLDIPRHPTHFPLQQNHQNPATPNSFSSSGPFFNGGIPGLHHRPVFSPYEPFSNGGFPGLDPRFVNFDNRLYPPHPFQETGWRNPSMNFGRGGYFERRGYHPYY